MNDKAAPSDQRGAMMEPLILQGRWWLPDSKGHKVFGTLTWDANDGGTLHLQDELRPIVWLDNVLANGSVQKYRADAGETTQRTYPLIFGWVDHCAYTLLDSFRLSAHEYDMEERVERVHVNRFLQGAWFDDPDGLRVDRLVIDMRHLTSWVDHSGLAVTWPQVEGIEADVFAVVTAKTLPPFTTEQDGVEIRLTQGLSGTGDHVHSVGVTEWWSLRLHKSEIEPLNTFLDIASDFQDLLSIAVGHTAQFEKVVMHHPELPALSHAGTPLGNMRQDITYYAPWSNRSAPREPVKKHDMYFTFDDLGGIDGVRRWLTVAADYRTELGRVMATRYREGMVLEDRIMNVSAALDSFDKHRRGDDNTRYLERISQCIELAGRPFLDLIAQDPARWAKSVKETRNDLAHHLERFRAEGSVGDHILVEQLFWLFTICMLRIAQAPDAVYEAISNHAQIGWLRERAQA
jgi:ApeA N-terminal domain 1